MFENKPLSKAERDKLNGYYLDVIKHYERVTKQPFMRDDLVILKMCVEAATPAAIKNTITRFYKMYPQNFTYFSYIYKPVTQMFKNKKRSV